MSAISVAFRKLLKVTLVYADSDAVESAERYVSW